jgi:hypothetical protein
MKIINLENSDILQNNFIDIKDTYVVKKGEDKSICEFSYDIGIKSNKKRVIQNNVFYEKIKNKMYWLSYDNNSCRYDSFFFVVFFTL